MFQGKNGGCLFIVIHRRQLNIGRIPILLNFNGGNMFRLKQLAVGFFLVFIMSSSVYAEDVTSNRINGISEFLLDRANDNFVYILQQRMESNRILQCYMPETYKYATSGNLQLLLQAGPKIWQESVENDLKNIGAQLIFNKFDPDTLEKWASDINNQYITALQNVTVEVDGERYPVDQLPLNASEELKDAVNSFYEDYFDAQEKIADIIKGIKNVRDQGSQDCPSTAYYSIADILKDIKGAIESIDKQISSFDDTDAGILSIAEFKENFMSFLVEHQRLEYYEKQIDLIRKEESLVVQMFKLDQLIRTSIKSNENPLISVSDMQEYNRFSHYALSFATLSEAKSSGQVKAVMKQLTLPPVSFAVKREPHARKFLVTAYFGMQGGLEFSSNQGDRGFGGLAVPVGFEYSYGLKKDVVSVMLAPFDFAHPINKILNSSEGSAELKDIFNPGIYLSYGFKKIPLVVGTGYSRGKSLTEEGGKNDGRILVFIGLDMPLFNLY
jgi:hypothetical protein